MKQAFAFVSYGMGGAALDPAGGEVALVAKIKALGVDVGASPYLYTDTQTIADAILATPAGSVIILGGDSLGANNAPFIATSIRTKRGIDYLFGFQPSLWGLHSTVPKSVVECLCIYNSNWLETFGLGDYPWRATVTASLKSQIASVQASPKAQVTVSDPKLAAGIPGVQVGPVT